MQKQEDISRIRRILLVDDDADELDMFEAALDRIAPAISVFHVTWCDRETLRSLPKPDLIFLDINMPVHSGFDWLRGIREKVPEHIPIIMYSTTRKKEAVAEAYQLGADLFVSKPDSLDGLTRVLGNVLHLDWSNPEALAAESFRKGRFHLVA